MALFLDAQELGNIRENVPHGFPQLGFRVLASASAAALLNDWIVPEYYFKHIVGEFLRCSNLHGFHSW